MRLRDTTVTLRMDRVENRKREGKSEVRKGQRKNNDTANSIMKEKEKIMSTEPIYRARTS